MKLSQEKRIELIKQLLEERQELSTRDIMTEFGVSQDTARRDIVLLTKKGEVKRTHGGILPLDFGRSVPNYQSRLSRFTKSKTKIAMEAGKYFYSNLAMQELHDIAFDTAFIAASGIDENGAYLLDQGDAEIVGLAVSRARKVILVAEHQKFVNKSYYRICPLDKISMFITDKALTPEQRAMFTDKTEIIVAN